MKKKSSKRPVKKETGETKALPGGGDAVTPCPLSPSELSFLGAPVGNEGYATPAEVAAAAKEEVNPRLVGDYAEAITILRDEKRHTFREIAEWLKKRFGIETDHNAVYRVYTKGMHEMDAAMAAVADEEDERDAA
jgi:hypothetical protein